MGTLDEVLNIGIPILLIVIVLGFLWVKFIEPWVVPMVVRLWEKMKGDPNQQQRYGKDIVYE